MGGAEGKPAKFSGGGGGGGVGTEGEPELRMLGAEGKPIALAGVGAEGKPAKFDAVRYAYILIAVRSER